ncbi:membrane bound O-acyl transferase [Gilbertella persicaria]|uniref:membrane bound O-acyl transferase n=1 Tax=Gilbertella persicaria TaxID=101096 RepID=UPI00221E7CA7|nr:membrane bound O-acyl transferase [Gilbertella persicaria]KAI8083331.1 membrane bound O-acyl transferase [Gilbertella persicaria]
MLFVLRLTFGFIHIIAISTLTYLICTYLPPTTTMAWTNFVLVMASMSLCHIHRQMKGIEGDTELDYSGALMILTIKLSSFGFNVLDNYSTNQKRASPHIVQFYGWALFFAGFLAGPTCEYMDYVQFVEANKAPKDSLKPALKRLCKSFLFIAALIYLAPTYNYFNALKPSFAHLSFWKKIFFIQLSAFLTRCKYYCVWFLSEGACILSGFGFNGYDSQGQPRWDRLNNVNVLSCEFAQSYKQLSENWNMGANRWLKQYVYLRLKPGSTSTTLITYIVSSVWHGFHPGFYLFFMTASVLQLVARQVRRTVRPLFLTAQGEPVPCWKSAYDVSTWLVSMGLLNMMVPCFDLLYVSRILHVWHQVYYCHFIVIGVGILVFQLIRPCLIKKNKKD